MVFGGLLIVLLLKIPWLKDALGRVGIKDGSGLSQTLILIVLAAIFIEVRTVAQRVDDMPSEQKHFADPLDVYPILLERIKSIGRKEEKRLDVLGMALYTAWLGNGDQSASAEWTREIFESWFTRACRDQWPLP